MKFIAVYSIFVILLSAYDAEAMEEMAQIFVKHSKEFMKNGTECKEKVGATEEDVASFMSRKLPNTTTGDCMIACMMEKMEIIVEGAFKEESPKMIAHSILGEEDLIADLIGDVAKACGKAFMSDEDKCVKARKIAECGLQHLKKFKDVTKKD